MNLSENEMLGLSGRKWEPIPKVARNIPYGYAVSEDDPETLVPVLLELEGLEKARKYRQMGYSLRECSQWLSNVTGRYISHVGIKKRLEDDRSKRGKAATLKRWASKYREAILKAKEWDRKKGNDLSLYNDLHSWLKEEADKD